MGSLPPLHGKAVVRKGGALCRDRRCRGMAKVRLYWRGSKAHLDWAEGGERFRWSIGQPDAREAERIRAAKEAELTQGGGADLGAPAKGPRLLGVVSGLVRGQVARRQGGKGNCGERQQIRAPWLLALTGRSPICWMHWLGRFTTVSIWRGMRRNSFWSRAQLCSWCSALGSRMGRGMLATR